MPIVDASYVARVQKRTVRLLVTNEIISGLGAAIGISVGALLGADLLGKAFSGVAQSSAIIGGALMALPVARIMGRYGRRPGLTLAYLVGAIGAIGVVLAAANRNIPLLLIGMFGFGAASTGKYQSRYAATDLAEPHRRGRQLSWVVWASTLGAVAGPNLAAPVGHLVGGYGVPTLAAPFVLSAVTFLFCCLWLTATLRPDPLRLAKQFAAADSVRAGTVGEPAPRVGLRETWRRVMAMPSARLGLASMAIGHLVMVAVMSMTPVHIGEAHSPSKTLSIVGFVIGLHIAGMYALSPIVGWLTDRVGRGNVILAGVGLLITACAVAGTAGHDTARLAIGLVLLGQGWSCTMVAGSTLLVESVPLEIRAGAQGLSDTATGLCGAVAGLLSGVIVRYGQFPTLALVAGLATVPLLALALRDRKPVAKPA
ncbi:MFS family permease [Allocatelliglobosispora scoriae]|uniref:MFS family permease n=1 Tax=Allocatelliglobosispora scoriae TaxID=643052 RepID=A0A841BXD0_9ACTN|nr:MFS transporter [Allocatelliglobosispora scoriae]MBB5872325.1 MFS family permease [Allocatelliglobosispora scoriae]